MLGPDVLEMAISAKRRFDSIGNADPATGQYMLDGRFTLHGVAQHIQVPVQAEMVNGMVHLRGKFAILQTQYGITPYSRAFGAVGVADKLTIWGDLWLYGR